MPQYHVLTHAVAALAGAAVVWLALYWRQRQGRTAAADEREVLRRAAQQARDEAEALRPQAMQALQLETTLTLLAAEHRRIQTESAQALEASIRRLAETESMAASLQQALIDARGDLAPPAATAGDGSASSASAATPAASSAVTNGTPNDDPQHTLAELRSRLAGIVSASRKWQRSGPPR